MGGKEEKISWNNEVQLIEAEVKIKTLAMKKFR
jgi:hypothetical protein